MTLTYLAEIHPKPECFAKAESAVQSIIAQTRAEEGCLEFTFYADANRERLYILETWTDMAAFEFHHAQDYVLSVMAEYGDWLHQPPVLTEITERPALDAA
ncbi:Putative monooxygenase [Tritonibacter multivorans]|uniref:Putative monooxygenase n=1 Tax=Tritonibacter multivorans TaxID=928856 RepID=A0A0P1G2Q3_9RHOB|nr:putative quinol monooxygenase [Tritonibacter multivorans]MDA7419742.1 putative quinol monooxygenase [Tritonibacter multivorans]CUH76086.1 Putative monooxygenase [Tritonibacter multivorans]SFC55584.1 Quinol monooxygenase YgiN [Tritonibacter multivorans]